MIVEFDNAILYKEQQALPDELILGTYVFMPPEILLKKDIAKLLSEPGTEKSTEVNAEEEPTPKYLVQHDMKGFLWSLGWFVRAKEAPGRHCPGIMSKKNTALNNVYRMIFISASAGNTKLLMLIGDGMFRNLVYLEMSRWCEPLWHLLVRFRRVIINTYKSKEFESLHDDVLHVFDEAIKDLNLPEVDEGYEEEYHELMETRSTNYPSSTFKLDRADETQELLVYNEGMYSGINFTSTFPESVDLFMILYASS